MNLFESFKPRYDAIIDLNKPIKDLTKKEHDIIFYGTDEKIQFETETRSGSILKSYDYFEGIIANLERRYLETNSQMIRDWIEGYMTESECPKCRGMRLSEKVLSVLIGGKNIFEVTTLSIRELIEFFDNLKVLKSKIYSWRNYNSASFTSLFKSYLQTGHTPFILSQLKAQS